MPTRRRFLGPSRQERGTIGEGDIGQNHQAVRFQDLRRSPVEARPIEVERALDRQDPVHGWVYDAEKPLGFSQAKRKACEPRSPVWPAPWRSEPAVRRC